MPYTVQPTSVGVLVTTSNQYPGYTEHTQYVFTAREELARYRDWVFRRHANPLSAEVSRFLDQLEAALENLPAAAPPRPGFDARWSEVVPADLGVKGNNGFW